MLALLAVLRAALIEEGLSFFVASVEHNQEGVSPVSM
jgi:hypothetical protein